VLLLFAYFVILARRKIGNFPRHELRNYVYRRVFWEGIGSLIPIIYLTAESLNCFLDNGDPARGGEKKLGFGHCAGVYFPQLSICSMFMLFLVARLIFIPLSHVPLDDEAFARFEGLNAKMKFQALLLAFVLLSNLVLFALMGEKELSPAIEALHYSELGCVYLIAVVEFVSILVVNAERRRRESQAARARKFVEDVSEQLGSLEVVH